MRRKQIQLSLIIMSFVTLVGISVWIARADGDWFPSRWGMDAYEYPVQPGTANWKAFDTHDEMVASVQIPEKTLKEMSTDGLVRTTLQYPLYLDVLAFNSFQQGMEKITADFNGLQELLDRPDAGKSLLSLYAQMDPAETSKYPTLDFIKVETLLAQRKILATLSIDERVDLLKVCREKIISKQQNPDVYSFIQCQSIAWVAGRILEMDSAEFRNMSDESEVIQHFLETGQIAPGQEDLETIVDKLEEVVNNDLESDNTGEK